MRALQPLYVVGLALVSAKADAQAGADAVESALQCDLETLTPLPRWRVSAQQTIVAAVAEANTCVDQRAASCAEIALAPIEALTLSSDERALVAMPRAELANLRGDSGAAVAIYREALALPAVGDGLRRDLAWRLALVLNARGEFAEALRVFDPSSGCASWGAEALALRGVAYENLGARLFAKQSFEAALKQYALEGRAVPDAFQSRYQALLVADEPEQTEDPDVLPLSRPNPGYPQRALERGLTGWVVLEFDVSEMGRVENVRVMQSLEDEFNEVAMSAVQQWRYVPRFENGLPMRREGLQTLLTFCLNRCNFRNRPPPQREADGRYLTQR